jgi:hypothetical protein
MARIAYTNIKAYLVASRLRGTPVENHDAMAAFLPCGGCGAPAGYFCLSWDEEPTVSRFTCKGIIGSQNPRTMKAFAKAAEEIIEGQGKK